MDNCLGGRRAKQKQQQQQNQQQQQQQQQQFHQRHIHPHHHHHRHHYEHQVEKSLHQENYDTASNMHPVGSNGQQQNNCPPSQGLSPLYPHFPPPPDYPPPINLGLPSSPSSPSTLPNAKQAGMAAGGAPTGGHQSSFSPTLDMGGRDVDNMGLGLAGGGTFSTCPDSVGIGPNGRRVIPARYPDDPDAIEICNEQEAISMKPGRGRMFATDSREASVKWVRDSQSPTLPMQHHQLHQDYSYAYYEPGAAMRHSNIPPPEQVAGPSRAPPPNSIRALLSKGKKNKVLVSPAVRQSYQTRYGGTQENFYEEISSDNRHVNVPSIRGPSSHSSGSINQSLVEEEFRRVQNRHRKILGELNLSVEAMLMPETPSGGSPTDDETPPHLPSSDHLPTDILLTELLNTVGPTDELLSPVTNTNPTFSGDLDSGFSGSSGASYIGSLRLHKTNAALSNLMTTRKACTPGPHPHQNAKFLNSSNSCNFFTGSASGSCRSSQRSHQDESGNSNFLSRSSYGAKTLLNVKLQSAEDPGPVVQTESKARSFWNRKGWRKLPGFSSTSSLHKAGLTDEPKLNSGSWEDPLPIDSAASTFTTAQLHNTPLRRSDPLNPRSSYNGLHNQLILPAHHHHSKSCGTPTAIGIGGTIGVTGTLSGSVVASTATAINASKKRLEHTPSARTINSSEDSWCSERSEQELSSEDEDDRSSVTSSNTTQQRNSQLRSTFNKAKQHLSFDKWRTSGGSGAINNNNSNQPPVQSAPGDNLNSSVGSNSNTMPTAHHHHHTDTTTPGESPGGRLSRWFSMRRGSSHHYDIGGRHSSSSSSIDTTDATTIENTSPKIASPHNAAKMPELPENEDDSTHPFGLDLIIPPGSRANGTARPHSRLITPSLPPPPPGLSQQQLKRRHIVAAIVHSENSYVATLQRLVNDYKTPLEESSPPVLNGSKIAILFHRLPDILQSHKMFRIALAECVRTWDRDEKLGDVFVSAFSKPHVLEVYSGFINNFSAAMELAKMEAKRKSALADFFKVKQISAHDRLSFFGLMVKPVQRFPQFILFLQDLLKYTPQGHHDRMSLQLALTQLESLAEMLNERKREAEQYQAFKEMLGHISGTFNTRSLASSDGSRQRYLLREDNVTQMEFNQAGFIVKSKQRRLLLLNDKVICVSVAPKQSHDFGATEKLSFKWMYPVADVEIVDNSTSATLSRILTAGLNRGGSLKSNSSSCNNDSPAMMLTNGADNLCNEMSTLMYDYEVISRINDLVGSLKGTYAELNTNVTRNVLNTIQGSIQRKDEEMAWVDSCCLQLIARNKSGKEETLTFQTENPSVKKEWITELRLAQLALDTNNSPAWELPENEQRPSTKMPLYVKAQPVFKSQHQTEVRCGCYYSIANDTKVGTARRRFKQQNYVWVCTSDGTSSHISVLSQHQQQAGNLRDVGSFDLVESQVTCMEHVKGLENCKTREEHNSLLGDLIWMGTESRKILIYSATNPELEEQLAVFSVPGIVTKILYHFDTIFVALSNATMLIFRRAFDGVWALKDPQTVQLGDSNMSVPSILPINMNIYASCANRVYVMNALTGDIQKSFEVQHGQMQQVNLMAHSGIGLWISLKNSSVLCLYHTETFKHLQDINIAASVLRCKPSGKDSVNNSSIYVTSLMACRGLLWVGTNVGIAVTIPLPRLEGVPIISGGVSMSCHAHFGPITFLLPLVPRKYSNYKPSAPSTLVEQSPPVLQQQHSVIGDDLQLPAIDADISKKDEYDETTVILRKDLKDSSFSGSEHDSPRSKLDKQNSLDQSFSAKIRAQLANSPALRRRRFRELSDVSRMSKTLPRGLGSAGFFNQSTNSNTSTLNHSDHGYCDVYGLYGKLIFVKEDYDAEDGGQGNLMDTMYEGMRRSDPELAAIPGKVSTLDRRLRMKASRPRSLDLSNWSVESKSSSLYTSSGSEESVGIRFFGGRSVSRNSSSASHKTGNGSDLGNISENGTITVDVHHSTPKSDDGSKFMAANADQAKKPEKLGAQPAATLKRKNKTNAKNASNDGPRTIITLMGGRGYWRHVWYNSTSPSTKTTAGSTGTMSRVANSNDAHIVIWEKKL